MNNFKKLEYVDYASSFTIDTYYKTHALKFLKHMKKLCGFVRTDCDKFFKKRRQEQLAKDTDAIEDVKYKYQYADMDLFSPSYGKLDSDGHILTAVSIFILDTVLTYYGTLEPIYKYLPSDRKLIEPIINTEIKDLQYSQELIASVEYVLRNRYKDFNNSMTDEIGYCRTLLARNTKDTSSEHYNNFIKILNLIPDEVIKYSLTMYSNYMTKYDTYLNTVFSKNTEVIDDLVDNVNNTVTRVNSALDVLNNDIQIMKHTTTAHAIMTEIPKLNAVSNGYMSPMERFLKIKDSYLNAHNNMMMGMMSIAINWTRPRTASVYDKSFEYNPYAMCFALLYLIEEDSDIPWRYGYTVNMMYTVVYTLPWGLMLDYHDNRSEVYSSYKFDVGLPSDSKVKRLDWYSLDYIHTLTSDFKQEHIYKDDVTEDCKNVLEQTEDLQDFCCNLVSMIYFATGFIMPRDLDYFEHMYEFLKGHKVRGNVNREMLYVLMAVLSNTEETYTALNLSNTDDVSKTVLDKSNKVIENKEDDTQEQIKQLKQTIKQLTSRIHDLETESSKQKNEKLNLEKLNLDKDVMIENLLNVLQTQEQQDNVSDTSKNNYSYPFIAEKRVLVYGGHDTFINQLRQLLVGNVKIIRELSKFDANAIANADSVWLQVNAIEHPFYWKIVSACKLSNTKLIYFNYASAKQCCNQIIDYYSE